MALSVDWPALSARRLRWRWPQGGGLMVALATLPMVVIVGLVLVVVWLSLLEGSPGDRLVTYSLDHYREVLLDEFTYRIFINTVTFSGIAVLVSMAFGLPLAWLLERTDFPLKPVVFTLMTIGILVPGFAVALGWVFLLHPRVGIINQMLMSALNLSEPPISIVNIVGMGIIEGLSLAPVVFIMTSIVFRSMNVSFEEAARMSRASATQTMLKVTLPLAMPGIVAAAIYVFAIGFAAFDIPAVIGLSGRIYTFSTYIYQAINPNDGVPEFGLVAVFGVVMIVLAAGLSALYSRMQRRAPQYALITGKSYRPAVLSLGRWKWPSVAFVVFYFCTTLAMPVLMLTWAALLPYIQPFSFAAIDQLSLQNFYNLPVELIYNGIRNTLILMIFVPTLALTFSLAISWVVLRSGVRLRWLYDYLAFLPHTIPAIVFSLAAWLAALFVFRDIIPLYGTIWILIIVYVTVRLSYGTRMTNSALIQIHKELDEAALMSGAPTLQVFRRILMPLLRPALLYAWLWIALLTYRELTLPVVLSTSENQPLSVLVWSLVSSSSYGAASAVALIMLVLMAPLIMAYWIVARRAQVVGQPSAGVAS